MKKIAMKVCLVAAVLTGVVFGAVHFSGVQAADTAERQLRERIQQKNQEETARETTTEAVTEAVTTEVEQKGKEDISTGSADQNNRAEKQKTYNSSQSHNTGRSVTRKKSGYTRRQNHDRYDDDRYEREDEDRYDDDRYEKDEDEWDEDENERDEDEWDEDEDEDEEDWEDEWE